MPAIFITRTKKSLKILKGYSEAVTLRTDNTMAKRNKKNETKQ